MKTIKQFLILAVAILISSCKNEKQLKHQYFDYNTLTDHYNSETNTFTRRYNYDDSINIKIKLTEFEKQSILKSFDENNFMNLSKEIDCSSWGVQPQEYTKISLWNKKTKHSVTYISTYENFMLFCPSGKKFLNIERKINDIIYAKQEIKSLPISEIAYE